MILLRVELSGFSSAWSTISNLFSNILAFMNQITIGGISLLVINLSLVALGLLIKIVLPIIHNESPRTIARLDNSSKGRDL